VLYYSIHNVDCISIEDKSCETFETDRCLIFFLSLAFLRPSGVDVRESDEDVAANSGFHQSLFLDKKKRFIICFSLARHYL
jgi:hypothetical protein